MIKLSWLLLLLPVLVAVSPAVSAAPALDPLAAGFEQAAALVRPAPAAAVAAAPDRASVERAFLEIYRRFDANLGALGHQPSQDEVTAALEAAKKEVDPTGEAMRRARLMFLSDLSGALDSEAKSAGLSVERYSDATQPEMWAGLLASIQKLQAQAASLPPEQLFAAYFELKFRMVLQILGSRGSAPASAQAPVQAMGALAADVLSRLSLPNVAKLG